MKIAIAGGTGFVGQELTKLLREQGHEIYILTRSEEKYVDGVQYLSWMNGSKIENHLEDLDAFVNLAGVSLNDGRWTAHQKDAIYTSRMDTTNEVLRIFDQLIERPNVFINASAVGIYPTSTTEVYTENSPEKASSFLGETVDDWEQKALQAEQLGIRTCVMRFGVILGKNEGALPLIVLPYQFFVGGTIGSGEQWLSWIHIEDVARAILHAIETPELSGPINVTSPNPKRMTNFGKIVARVLHRPHWLPVPSFALQLALGEKSVLVLEGQYVMPEKLLMSGFTFKFSSLENAIKDLYK